MPRRGRALKFDFGAGGRAKIACPRRADGASQILWENPRSNICEEILADFVVGGQGITAYGEKSVSSLGTYGPDRKGT